jgi:hypothetical protein
MYSIDACIYLQLMAVANVQTGQVKIAINSAPIGRK